MFIQVTCDKGQNLGLEIEGGSDTSLKYTYINSLVPNSPAWQIGMFREGDQLVMVGDECLIGMTTAEAKRVLERVKGNVEIVAQRKESPWQTPNVTPYVSTAEIHSSFQPSGLAPRSHSNSISSMDSAGRWSRSGSIDSNFALTLGQLDTSFNQGTGLQLSQSSFANVSQQGSHGEIREYLIKQEKKASLVPEETYTIELKKTAKQKLGLAVVGGIDNPNLKEVHVCEHDKMGSYPF